MDERANDLGAADDSDYDPSDDDPVSADTPTGSRPEWIRWVNSGRRCQPGEV
jgi:hypothetical protein